MRINRKKHKPCFACKGVGYVEPELVCEKCAGYGSVALKVLAVPADSFRRLNEELNASARWDQFFARVTK